MAHGRSFRGRGISDAQRRKKSWSPLGDGQSAGSPIGFRLAVPAQVAAGSDATLLFFGTSLNPGLAESTILRIRGSIDVPKSVDSGVGSHIQIAFGICVVPELSAGVTPNPATLEGQNWDGWMFLRSSTQIALDVQGTMLDVKAQRKIKSGDALVLIAGVATDQSGGAAEQIVFGNVRALVLLP